MTSFAVVLAGILAVVGVALLLVVAFGWLPITLATWAVVPLVASPTVLVARFVPIGAVFRAVTAGVVFLGLFAVALGILRYVGVPS